jgi:magnesium-transporting ATPase (P-type)
MAAASEYSMSTADREFLRRKTGYLIKNLLVDEVCALMTDIFDQNSEDLIRAEPTPQKKIIKFIDLLSRSGAKAFNAFLVATYQVQEYLALELAEERGVNLNAILLEGLYNHSIGIIDDNMNVAICTLLYRGWLLATNGQWVPGFTHRRLVQVTSINLASGFVIYLIAL